MKRSLLLLVFFIVAFSAWAADNKRLGLTKKGDEGMIRNGLYIHVGAGRQYIGAYPELVSRWYGFQGNIEFGNQWMFFKREKWGIGINVTWLSIGGGYGKLENEDGEAYDLNLNVGRFGPMATFRLGEKSALDVFFNINPTFIANSLSTENASETRLLYGWAYVPGIRFRYKKLAVGFEAGASNLRLEYYDGPFPHGTYYVPYFNSRIFVGVKF